MWFLDKMSPETMRVFAAALEHRNQFREKPSAQQVIDLAEAEGASVGACLALVRYELLSADGEVVPLRGPAYEQPPAVLSDAETIYAVLCYGRPGVILETPQRKRFRFDLLPGLAKAWEES